MLPVNLKGGFTGGNGRSDLPGIDNQCCFFDLRAGQCSSIRIIFRDPDQGFIGRLRYCRGSPLQGNPDRYLIVCLIIDSNPLMVRVRPPMTGRRFSTPFTIMV